MCGGLNHRINSPVGGIYLGFNKLAQILKNQKYNRVVIRFFFFDKNLRGNGFK